MIRENSRKFEKIRENSRKFEKIRKNSRKFEKIQVFKDSEQLELLTMLYSKGAKRSVVQVFKRVFFQKYFVLRERKAVKYSSLHTYEIVLWMF